MDHAGEVTVFAQPQHSGIGLDASRYLEPAFRQMAVYYQDVVMIEPGEAGADTVRRPALRLSRC
jgi:hypothetical protein